MAYISQYSCGSSYIQLQVNDLNPNYDQTRTYYWYISLLDEKPRNYTVKNEDALPYQSASPVATLGGLTSDLLYHVWCDIYLQDDTIPSTTLNWSGKTLVEHSIEALATYAQQSIETYDASGDTENDTNATTVSVTVSIGGDVSSVDVYFNGTSHIVYESDGSRTFYVSSGTSVTLKSVTPSSGYTSPYLLYYNTAANPGTYSGPKSFTVSTTISDTSFNRLLSISATKSESSTTTVSVRVGIGGGVSSVDTFFDSTSHIVYNEDTSKTFYITAGTSVRIRDVVPQSGYTSPYLLYYNTAANPNSYFGPTEFTLSTTISDTSFDRKLSVSATEKPIVYVYVTVSTGVKQLDVVVNGTSYTIYPTSGQRGFRVTPGDTVRIQNVKAEDGYNSRFRLYYNTESDPDGEHGPDTFSGVIIVDDTTYDRYLRVTAIETIDSFSWTANDATNIAAGQPVSNITATAWSDLIDKIAAVGGGTSTIPVVSAGTKMTAYQFNQMRNAISGLTGVGSVASAVSAGATILATLFANNEKSLKSAINRAINNYNTSA